MKFDLICFTKKGCETALRLKDKLAPHKEEGGIDLRDMYFGGEKIPEGFEDALCPAKESISGWIKKRFEENRGIIFIGAMGILVRSVSESIKDKMKDPPVIVMDDNGNYVIPVLSGHVGGANEAALLIAKAIDAIPVITTSSDINDAFSADLFAKQNNLKIINREGIKRVNRNAIEERKVTLSVKDYPPKDKVDVLVSDEDEGEYLLRLSEKKYTVGVGLKKGISAEVLEERIDKVLKENGIDRDDVFALCTIDIKEDEPAILSYRDKYRIPVISFDKDILNKAEGEFSSSDFVKEITGVDNVCERAAVIGAGRNGFLIVRKQAGEGITIAIAKHE